MVVKKKGSPCSGGSMPPSREKIAGGDLKMEGKEKTVKRDVK